MIFLKRSKKSGINKMKKVRNKKIFIVYIIMAVFLCDFLYVILYLKDGIPPRFNYIPECITSVERLGDLC